MNQGMALDSITWGNPLPPGQDEPPPKCLFIVAEPLRDQSLIASRSDAVPRVKERPPALVALSLFVGVCCVRDFLPLVRSAPTLGS